MRGEIIIEDSQRSSVLAFSSTSTKIIKEKCTDCQIHQYEHGTLILVPKDGFQTEPIISFNSAFFLDNFIK